MSLADQPQRWTNIQVKWWISGVVLNSIDPRRLGLNSHPALCNPCLVAPLRTAEVPTRHKKARAGRRFLDLAEGRLNNGKA